MTLLAYIGDLLALFLAVMLCIFAIILLKHKSEQTNATEVRLWHIVVFALVCLGCLYLAWLGITEPMVIMTGMKAGAAHGWAVAILCLSCSTMFAILLFKSLWQKWCSPQ